MTAKELKTQLETTGFPVAYLQFKKPPDLPYLIFMRTSSENISSDYQAHGKRPTYAVELYTMDKDLQAEAKVEAVLNSINSDYSTDEIYIDSEKMLEVRYEIELIDRR